MEENIGNLLNDMRVRCLESERGDSHNSLPVTNKKLKLNNN